MVLPVNLCYQQPPLIIKEQFKRLTSIDITHANKLNILRRIYPVFNEISIKKEDAALEGNIPIVFYYAVFNIKESLAASKINIDIAQIALTLGEVWPEILAELGKKIADPSIIYGTDIFYDICKRGYLCQHSPKEKIALFKEINEYAHYLPLLHANIKDPFFNDYLRRNNLTTLHCLKQLERVEEYAQGTNPYASRRQVIIHSGRDNFFKLIQYSFKNYLEEEQRLLWCYENACLIFEDKKNETAITIATVALYFFDEKESLISKEFVEVFYGKHVNKSLLKDAINWLLEKQPSIDTNTLILSLSEMSEEACSDWIEGILLLFILDAKKDELIKNNSNIAALEKLIPLCIANPSSFSKIYRTVEDMYRERFKLCSVVESNNLQENDKVKNLFGSIKANGYSDEIVRLMSIFMQKDSEEHMCIKLVLYLYEIYLSILHSFFELLSWAMNHKIQLIFSFIITLVLTYVDLEALVELIGIEEAFDDFLEFVEDELGPVSLFIIINLISSAVKKTFTLIINLFTNPIAEKIEQSFNALLLKEMGGSQHGGRHNKMQGFDVYEALPSNLQPISEDDKIPYEMYTNYKKISENISYADVSAAIKASDSVADLFEQYQCLKANHALSRDLLKTIRDQFLNIVAKQSGNDASKIAQVLRTINGIPQQKEMVHDLLNHSLYKFQRAFGATTYAYDNFCKAVNVSSPEQNKAAVELLREAALCPSL
jgi:hypothetical protein